MLQPAPRDYGVESAKIAASVKTTPLAIRITEPAVAHAVGSVLAAKRNATKATTAKTAANNVGVCTVIATTCLVNVVAVQVGRDHCKFTAQLSVLIFQMQHFQM